MNSNNEINSDGKSLRAPLIELAEENNKVKGRDSKESLREKMNSFEIPKEIASKYVGKGRKKEQDELRLKKCQEEINDKINSLKKGGEILNENDKWFVAIDYLRERKPKVSKMLRVFEECFIDNLIEDLEEKEREVKDNLGKNLKAKQIEQKEAQDIEDRIDDIIYKVNEILEKNEKNKKKHTNKEVLDSFKKALSGLSKEKEINSIATEKNKSEKSDKKEKMNDRISRSSEIKEINKLKNKKLISEEGDPITLKFERGRWFAEYEKSGKKSFDSIKELNEFIKRFGYKPEPAYSEKEWKELSEEFQFGKIWRAKKEKREADKTLYDFIVKNFYEKSGKLGIALIKKGDKETLRKISPEELRKIKEEGSYEASEYESRGKKEKNGKKKKDKKEKFHQRETNPADETASLESDPGNPGGNFDFINKEKEAEYKNEIEKAGSFEEFYEVIKEIGRMENNSGNIVLADRVVKKIETTRKKLKEKSENFDRGDKKFNELWRKHLDLIPKICGIQNKAGELIRKEIYGGKEESNKHEEASQEKEKEFTEGELKVVEVFKNYAENFREKLEAEADWTDYSDEQKNDTIKIQTAVAIKRKIKEKKLFAGKEDRVIEIVLENKI